MLAVLLKATGILYSHIGGLVATQFSVLIVILYFSLPLTGYGSRFKLDRSGSECMSSAGKCFPQI